MYSAIVWSSSTIATVAVSPELSIANTLIICPAFCNLVFYMVCKAAYCESDSLIVIFR